MKIIKRIAIWLGIAFFFLFIASVVIAVAFEDEIGQRLLAEINKELVSDLQVESFRLSLIKGFPNVDADLQKVTLPDNQGGVLLEAESMAFKIGLFGLLTSDLQVKSVLVEDGALFVSVNRRGKANYLITKPSKNQAVTTETGSFALSLDEAVFKNIELIYVDERAKQEMKLQLDNASFSGKFDNEQFSLVSDADIRSDFVEIDNRRYVVGKKLSYDAKIYVDLESYFYEFQEVEFSIDRNKFNIGGTIEPTNQYTDFNLEITAKKGSLESVIQLLPEDYKGFEGFESSGQFNFDATIKGYLNEKENPVVNINFGLEDGNISHDILDNEIQDVSFAAKFKGGKTHSGKSSVFEINDFKGYFNKELIESQLKISNLEDPTINFQMDGTLPLKSAYSFFASPMITHGDGELEFKDFQVSGRYADMINPSRIHRVKANGILELDDAALIVNGQEIFFDGGTFTLKNNDLDVKKLTFESEGTNLTLQGSINNFLPVLLADSINSNDAKLRFNATLKSDKLDLDKLLSLTEVPQSYDNQFAAKGIDVVDSTKIENIHRKEAITNFLEGIFIADIESFNYDLIEGESFTGQLEFKNKKMTIVGEAEAMGGFFDIDAVGSFEKQPTLKLKVICNDIDAKEFFRQGKNFGQEVLESRHVEGTLNAKMVIRTFWDAEGSFLYDELKVLAGVKVENGELNNFELFDEFSTYANSRDLKQVKFVDMENWFEIKNEHIYIPKMFVQSNAMNLFLSGEHTFDNLIDYNIKVNAGQILLSKLKKHNSNLDPQPAKQNGLFNLYFNVSGDIEDYEVQTNKRKVKKQFEDSEYQKRRIQKALTLEFGRNKVNRKLEKPVEKMPEFEDSESEEFLDPIQGNTDNSLK